LWIAGAGRPRFHPPRLGPRLRISVKFNPALRRQVTGPTRRRWILGCIALRIEQAANPVWRIEVYHRRLVVAALVLGLSGYLAGATALWLWLDRNPHNQARWLDVLQLPWRWDELRVKRGETAIVTARERLKARDYVEAFHHLRTGLARAPGNVEGRVLLAQMLVGHDPQRALELMEAGIPHAGADPRFLGALFAFYHQLQIQAAALERLDQLRARPPAGWGEESRALVGRTRAHLLAAQGRTDEALAEVQSLPPGPLAAVTRADVLLRAGRATEARDALADVAPPGVPAAELARRHGEIAVALGDADALLGALRRWRAAASDEPAPYLYGFSAWHRLNRASYRDAAEREYYQLFGRNDGALQALAALAVSLDLPDVVERARHVALSQRASAFAYLVHLTEIELRRGSYEAAVRRLREWEDFVETLQPAQRFYPEFIKRLARAAFAGGETEADALLAHLTAHRGQAQLPVWLMAARIAERAGQPALQQKILRPALAMYPRTDELLAMQGRIEQGAALAPKAVAAGPARAAVPATAREALARFDELLAAESLAAARDLLRAVRAERPGWLEAAAPAVARREIELAFATADRLTTRSHVRQYLGRHRDTGAALALVDLARAFAKQGRADDARLVADEIMAAQPTEPVRKAVADLNLPDDLADLLATQEATLGALDRWISAAHWTEAERLLQAVRTRSPEWAAGEPTPLKIREVQVRLGLDQRPAALAALKEITIKGGVPRGAAFQLVREYLAAGEQDTAILLAREIVRVVPGDSAAEKLLQEARAPRPAG